MSRTIAPLIRALSIPMSRVKSSKLSLISDSFPASLSITAITVSAIFCAAFSMLLECFSIFESSI